MIRRTRPRWTTALTVNLSRVEGSQSGSASGSHDRAGLL